MGIIVIIYRDKFRTANPVKINTKRKTAGVHFTYRLRNRRSTETRWIGQCFGRKTVVQSVRYESGYRTFLYTGTE
jgi:hypothetical protein